MSDFSPRTLRSTSLLSLAIGALLASCAAPNSDLSYYELPSNGGASVQPAIIEGTLVRRDRWVCAYVFSIDGQRVGDRGDCTAAVPISPGKHTIVAYVQGNSAPWFYLPPHRPPSLSFDFTLIATATLTFDALEGHGYKISLARLSLISEQVRANVWVSEKATRAQVTEVMVAASPL